MFSNVPRNKNRITKKQEQQQETKDHGVIASSDKLLVTNINKKLSRCFRGEPKVTLDNSQCPEVREQPLSEVSSRKIGFNSSIKKISPLWCFDKLNPRKNCTAINGKKTSDQYGSDLCTSENFNSLRARGNSDVGRQNCWISSIIKDSLKRTLSLQAPSKFAKASFVNRGRKDSDRSSKVKKNSRNSTNRSSRFAKANRHFKYLLSSHVTKVDSWLSSITVLFILISITLFGLTSSVVKSASIPTPRVQPIWLLDGLISLDPNTIDNDGDAQTSHQTFSLSEIPLPNQELLRLKNVEPNRAFNLQSSKVNQANEPPYYELERSSIGRTRDSWYPTLNQYVPSETVDPSEQPKDELVWLQRRRLDRDRALEPPPWLRVRPMRRLGLSSGGQSESEIDPVVVLESEKSENSDFDDSSLSGDDIKPRQLRGGLSRGSPDDIYQGILQHIVDQALADSSLLDQLYEELETKIKSNRNHSKSARLQQQVVVQPANGNREVQVAQGQEEENISSDTITQDASLQESEPEPDTAIVVVGDEVSSGDDVTALDSFANLRSSLNKAGFTDLSSAYDNIQNDETQSNPEKLDTSADFIQPQASRARGVISSFYNTQNLGRSANLLANPNIQLSESSVISPQHLPSSFHVLEDVDRLDSAQDLPTDVYQQRQPELQQFSSVLSNWKLEKPNPTFKDESISLNINSKRNSAILSQQRSSLTLPKVSSSSRGFFNSAENIPHMQPNDQLAISVVDRGYLSRNQLLKAATKLKNYLEDSIGLSRTSILGLYPLNNEELLIKIDQNKLTDDQLINMVTNYGFVRGYIVASWRKGSRQSPLPLISAILRALASNQDEMPLFIEPTGSLATQEVASDVYQLSPQLLNEYVASYQLEGTANMIKPTLAAYLDALLLAERSKTVALANQRAELNGYSASLRERRWYNFDSKPAYLLAFVGGLIGVFLAVKLLTRCSGAQVLRERFTRSGSFKTLWSSYSDLVNGGPATGKEAEAGNLSHLIAPKADELSSPTSKAGSERESHGFTQLSRRLSALLRRHEKADAGYTTCDVGKRHANDELSNSNEIDEDALEDEKESEVRQTTRFRSSRSYIRSLVETLSKSRVALSMNPTDDNNVSVVNTNNNNGTNPTKKDAEQKNVTSSQECSAVAQMNISGAHLILDYMEKHLEDKERLKREWLALNGRPGKPKLAQVLIQRLARVGLSEECAARNRNSQVVPFDRNRVRLGGNWTKTSNDYINASYIHDDDLRKPTHIIAQGPTDLTSGHFWQMVWEQGVSVIVMLTRLNENGTKMCHCYWPANSSCCTSTSASESVNVEADGSSGLPSRQSTTSPPRDLSKGDLMQSFEQQQLSPPSDGRRVSVTSVFSGQGGKPIVANGDLANNIISFEVELSSAGDSLGTGSSEVKPVLKLEVHLVSEHVSSSDYLVRNMYLINRSTCETRTITQFHYLDWPENGVPRNVRNFLEFRRKVHKSYRNLKSPILVHCSDGAGRSGTYTLIDIILERIRSGAKEIDPRATLEHLRDQRMGLCASQSQFEFVLVALAEEIQIILDALPH